MAINKEPSNTIALVHLVHEGDPDAQNHFIALLRRRVRTISMAILGHPQDAEDASQNIMIELLRSAHTYRGGNLYAWADRISVRTAARHARLRRVRAAQIDADALPESLPGAKRGSWSDHAIPRPILEYLAELPEARRTVLVLRHVLEYSVEEIAEITETSPNTVKDRLLQARKQVRRLVRREAASTTWGVSS